MMMRRSFPQFTAFFLFITFGWYATMAMSTEKPAYSVIERDDNIEIRRYQPMIIAEVSVNGKRDQAATAGFRLLADYIFGNNTGINQSSEKIAMTAPVQQQQNNSQWQISFVMPSQYTMDMLPVPNNGQVTLTRVKGQTMVAIRFSGLGKGKNLAKHEQQLRDYIAQNNLSVQGDPIYAFYDAPWVPGFFRRNEIMFRLAGEE